ncbi:MAG: SH3 domain-containing protein, partial [Candidatus Limnocylindrales bacterium]
PGTAPSTDPAPSAGSGFGGLFTRPSGGAPTSDDDSGSSPFRWPAIEVDPIVAFALVAWLLTTTVGVLLFAAVFEGRHLGVELPAELSVLVIKRWRAVRPVSRPEDRPYAVSEPTPAEPLAPAGTAPGDVAIARPEVGPTVRAPLQFSAPPVGGAERRIVAYQSVRVSATPDDLRSAELTRLVRRDEVEVIGEAAGSLRIRTPDGIEGWVARVVLVGPPADRPNPWAVTRAEPIARRRRWLPAFLSGAKATRSAAPPPAAPPA